MGAVNGASFEADAVHGGLNDNVLFGMNRPADFRPGAGRNILRVAQAAQFQAVFYAGRSAVVTGGEDVFIFYSHRAHMMPQAGAAFRNY